MQGEEGLQAHEEARMSRYAIIQSICTIARHADCVASPHPCRNNARHTLIASYALQLTSASRLLLQHPLRPCRDQFWVCSPSSTTFQTAALPARHMRDGTIPADSRRSVVSAHPFPSIMQQLTSHPTICRQPCSSAAHVSCSPRRMRPHCRNSISAPS